MDSLTARESEILALLKTGLKNREIADQLDISNSTVENHLRSIYAKLRVSTRTAAVAACFAVNNELGTSK
jgi:LuxR family transcriptional regulator, maltose regulon positive regulatory protein